MPLICFNSIKVRLNPTEKCARNAFDLFQFHKGTIKPRVTKMAAPVALFQFHKGTIKPLLPCLQSLPATRFNSIKVRLNHARRRILVIILSSFNSIKVRLNPSMPLLLSYVTFVSIP